MNVSLKWLSSHLSLEGKSLAEISDLFTFAGVEVEGIWQTGIPSPKIVVAQIKEARPHPNADKLAITQVDCGERELRQIVCGAKNYKVGDKVPCCLPGTNLGDFTISDTKMRGEDSKGMLAAAEEIGLPKGEDGLLILPADSPIGTPLQDIYPSDTILELEVTPNRPDLLSHRGMARELATLLQTPLITEQANANIETAVAADNMIQQNAQEACPFYTLTQITDVKVGESPAWITERLSSIGLKPVNNVVDITNFVLHETGQPLHAFDADKVNLPITIRCAKEGELFTALDKATYTLAADDLLISDASGAALALAGIMGGFDSGVTSSTTSILLESAYFTPSGIRRTARRTSLSSDSSYRFERGADPEAVLSGASLAIQLMNATAAPTQILGEAPAPPKPVSLNLEKLHRLLGNSITTESAEEILIRLGLQKTAEGSWNIPSYRQDLTRHIDLVEEITRVHGLANIPSRLQAFPSASTAPDHDYDSDMVLRRRLAALGLNECQTIKLISSSQISQVLPLRPLAEGDLISVKYPLSEDHAILRPSIIPGLLSSAMRNSRQLTKSLRLFEIGRTFRNVGGGKSKNQETDCLGILLSGPRLPISWDYEEINSDLYDLKAILAALLPNQEITFKPKEREKFALGSDIKAGDQVIGVFARLLPKDQRELNLPDPVYLAELSLPKLRKLIHQKHLASQLPQYPGSTRDAAIEIPIQTLNSEITAAIAKANEPLLVSSECFDVFADPKGERLAADRKSIAYRFIYRDPMKTLKQKDVDYAHSNVMKSLKEIESLSFR